MIRAVRLPLVACALAAGPLASTGCGSPCQDDGVLAICGDFGALAFQANPGPVQWPGAATTRSSLLLASDEAILETVIPHHQQAGRIPGARGPKGDAVFGQVEIEIGDTHPGHAPDARAAVKRCGQAGP